jgi:hypothetical protein
MLTTIIIILLVFALLGVIPIWPYSLEWGHYPNGLLGIAFVILLLLFLKGWI